MKVLLGAILGIVALGVGCGVMSYNKLNSLEQNVQGQWAEVQNAYQRRLDLIPNLVETVKGAAAFEKDTMVEVTQARARAGQVVANPSDPASFQKFQEAQDQLSSSLSRLLVVVEKYPDLKATAAFRDLMVQLEGTENRIAVARRRFNEAAQQFNTKRNEFPTVLFAGVLGSRFADKQYFQSQAGADQAPQVKF